MLVKLQIEDEVSTISTCFVCNRFEWRVHISLNTHCKVKHEDKAK